MEPEGLAPSKHLMSESVEHRCYRIELLVEFLIGLWLHVAERLTNIERRPKLCVAARRDEKVLSAVATHSSCALGDVQKDTGTGSAHLPTEVSVVLVHMLQDRPQTAK